MSNGRLLFAVLMAATFFTAPGQAGQPFDKGAPRQGSVFMPGSPGGGPGSEPETEEQAEDAPADDSSQVSAENMPSELTDEQKEEVVRFVIGNSTFIMFHEAGHMLISELGLPVLGREEDAVDTLSAILLLEGRDETLDQAITDSADGWFLSGEQMAEDDEYAFWDSHGIDDQRAYQIVCMMVGHDAEGFKEFADSIEYPQDRREECVSEYEQARTSWYTLLNPHLNPEGKKSKIEVVYEKPSTADQKPAADLIKESKLLENAAEMFGDLYQLKPGIRFVGKSCGEPNAYWFPGDRQVTFCYELAQYYIALDTQWHLNNPDG